MLGNFASRARFSTSEGAKAASAGLQELYGAARMDGSSLPQAPKSAFRKRPVRLQYDKNEFYTFRLPSENTFLLGNFEKNDLFGKRTGTDHAPQYRA